MDANGFNQMLSHIEAAARIAQSGSTDCEAGKRREAEEYLLRLRLCRGPYEFCKFALESAKTTSDYVRYQIVCIFKESIIREWHSLDSPQIENYWLYLLNYVCANSAGQSSYVTSEILLTIAMIVKRGTFDGKCGETDKIYDTVTNMISSGENQMISLACQILLNICTEYCTAWKSSVGLTWDFHIRAKRHFEQVDLKKIFGFALTVLHSIVGEENFQSNSPRTAYIDKFLNLAVCTLNWNFGSKSLPKRLTYGIEFTPATVLRPPDTWRDVFHNLDILKFFFSLHSKVRPLADSLCHLSMQCLIQLVSLSSAAFKNIDERDAYLALFVSNSMQLFQSGVSRSEAPNFAEMIHKLLNNRPLQTKADSNVDLIENFYRFLTRITCEFCQQAAVENWENNEDPVYQEAHWKILDSWSVLLRVEGQTEADESKRKMTDSAACVFDCYFRCHLSAPLGNRPDQPLPNTQDGADDEPDDDKQIFCDVLHSVGVFGRHSIHKTIDSLIKAFYHLIGQYGSIVGNITINNSHSSFYQENRRLENIQEDLHWLLLITSHCLTVTEAECIFYVPVEVYKFSSNLSANNLVDINSSLRYLSDCVTSPTSNFGPKFVDPVVELIGCVVRWSVIERDLMISGRQSLLSPQVAESACYCLRRIMSAYYECEDRYATPTNGCALKETFKNGTSLSFLMVELMMDKFFIILSHWPSEIRLNKEAALMLISFLETDHIALQIAKNENVMRKIEAVSLDALCPAARKDLLKCIAKMCLSAENLQAQKLMDSLVLFPLQRRYVDIVELIENRGPNRLNEPTDSSQLLNVLDCFSGVVQGVGPGHGAKFIFYYVMPVLNSSTVLLSVYKNEQPVVDAVLQLFSDVTSKLTSCLGDQHDAEIFYHCILAMLRCYASNNAIKYVEKVRHFDEDKISDLLLFLDILQNLLSKDIFIQFGGDSAASAPVGLGAESAALKVSVSTVIVTGLETILPIMTGDFLKYPPVCCKFYKLITNLCQLYTAHVCRFPIKIRHDLLQSVKVALSFDYGSEAVIYALTFLNALSSFLLQYPDTPSGADIKSDLVFFLSLIFETCLKASCEVELLHAATVCLFTLICLNHQAYERYVQELIASHEDSKARMILCQAFQNLLKSIHLPENRLSQNQFRKDKLAFREKFETFLDSIQGVLKI